MKIVMNDLLKGANGRINGRSDVSIIYNERTGKNHSYTLSNKRDLNRFPYSKKEKDTQSAFRSRTMVVCSTIKNLTEEQRQKLTLIRNERHLFSIRQLIESIYDSSTNSIPEAALEELLKQAE